MAIQVDPSTGRVVTVAPSGVKTPIGTTQEDVVGFLAAAPAASRDAIGAVNISPSEQLIEAMKRAGIWTACVALKVFGKDSTERGYALNFETGGFTRVRCGDFKPTSSSVSVPIAASLSSCAIYTATVGGEVPEVGTERTILQLHSGVTPPFASFVRIFKATSSGLTIQLLGGGSQSFHNPATTVAITNGTAPRTCFVNLDVSTNSVTIGIDGVLQTPLTYTHGDPAAMARITGGGMQATYNTIAVFNRPLTETEYVAFDSAVKNTVFSNRANIVLEGDSIIGYFVSGVQMHRRYLLGAASGWAGETWYDISTGGNATSDVITQWPAQLDTYIAQGAIDRSIVVLWLGANDFGNYTAAARPVAQIHANLRTLWAIAKARGFKVVAVVPYYLPVRLADYPTLRNLILADEGIYYDVCIDMHAAFNSAVGGSYWLNTAYFGDGVHPTTVDAQRIIATAFDEVSDRVFLR
jgi:lysophospholipase L1-like esterase